MTFIEVLDRRGRLVGRHRIERWPVTIGRAYSNDVIVDDPYVCPRHLRLVRDGDEGIIAEDLGSVNGVRAEPNGTPSARLAVGLGGRIRIGNTVLRLRRSDVDVPAALEQHHDGHASRLFTSTPIALAWWLVIPLVVWQRYLFHAFERTRLWETAGMGIMLVVMVSAWAAAWSLVNRVVGHEWRFPAHAAAMCAFLVLNLLAGLLGDYAKFLLAGSWPGLVLVLICGVAPIAWLLDTQLALVGAMRRAHRSAAAMTTALALVGLLTFLSRWEGYMFSNQLRFDAVLRPFPRAWIPGAPIETLTSDATRLEDDVRRLEAEK